MHQIHNEGVGHEHLTAENIVVAESDVTVTDWRFDGTGEPQEATTEELVSRLGSLVESLLTENEMEISERLENALRRATVANRADRYDSLLKFADMLRWAGRTGR